jgi:hypothetical protein
MVHYDTYLLLVTWLVLVSDWLTWVTWFVSDRLSRVTWILSDWLTILDMDINTCS